jgi:hypothetical protein
MATERSWSCLNDVTALLQHGWMNRQRGSGFFAEFTPAAARNLLLILLAIELVFAALYVVLQVYVAASSSLVELRHLVDVNQEITLTTWFSTTQLAALSLLLFVLAEQLRDLRRPLMVFALMFLFFSMDEGAALHDRLYGLARKQGTFGDAPYLAWMLPYAVIAVVLLLFLWKPLDALRRRASWEALLATAGMTVFIGGGVVLEILQHYVLTVTPRLLPFVLVSAAEEFCEMAGVTLVLYAFLSLGISAPTGPVGHAEPENVTDIETTPPILQSATGRFE